MAKPKPGRDPKAEALARDGALNPHPEAVRDTLFAGNPFFDARDLVQVRYEMVRRHQADRVPISDVASAFGVSRPTFYKAQSALADQGPRRAGAPTAGSKGRTQDLCRGDAKACGDSVYTLRHGEVRPRRPELVDVGEDHIGRSE